jgi:hypothetical protein
MVFWKSRCLRSCSFLYCCSSEMMESAITNSVSVSACFSQSFRYVWYIVEAAGFFSFGIFSTGTISATVEAHPFGILSGLANVAFVSDSDYKKTL